MQVTSASYNATPAYMHRKHSNSLQLSSQLLPVYTSMCIPGVFLNKEIISPDRDCFYFKPKTHLCGHRVSRTLFKFCVCGGGVQFDIFQSLKAVSILC